MSRFRAWRTRPVSERSRRDAEILILTHPALNTWWGSLINEKTDASGLK
jgi:hypothetical protein